MKRNKHQKRHPEQLEFEDLVAETTDICIRMRSIRRKDLIFCPLRIRGWQTTEAQYDPFTPAPLNDQWLDQAFQNIHRTETVRGALITTASYLSAILDLDLETTADEDSWRTKYSAYCDQVIETINPDTSSEDEIALFIWKTAQTILECYDSCHAMNDWELREHLESALTNGSDLEQTLKSERSPLFGIFTGCLAYIYGWIGKEYIPSAIQQHE